MLEEVWNLRRLDILPELCQRDACLHLPKGRVEGRDTMRDTFIVPVLEAFPDIVHEIDELIVQGNRVAMRFHGSGTHRGAFAEKAATSKRLDYAGITIFHMRDGKVSDIWNYSNWSEAFAAL
ncbi:ester cyclase [Marimonas sp. MJW-29]|uniref:Ester cyclase n=1 Tax=Sulfitobacter sediminis TaxID=3234186 RepID=A0ABV3RUU8_9RHOB